MISISHEQVHMVSEVRGHNRKLINIKVVAKVQALQN